MRMLKTFRFFKSVAQYGAALSFFASISLAGPVAVLQVRGAESLAKKVADALHVTVTYDATKEFANGNTGVRIGNVKNAEVLVVIPTQMTPNVLMEALIKIRTAKTSGAASVGVLSQTPLTAVTVLGEANATMNLPLEKLFAEAGAGLVREGSSTRTIQALHPPIQQATGKSVVFSRTHRELAKNIADRAALPFETNIDKIEPGTEVFLVEGSAQPANLNLLKAIEAAATLSSKGASVRMIFPYLPYARSDKVDVEGTTTTGRLVADLVESTGVRSVTFIRAHAPQSQGFFKVENTNITGRPTINKVLRSLGVQAVISPDAGFQKDATLYADELGVGVSVVNKQRNPATDQTELKGISGDPVTGKTVVITDDETASGGTLAKVAKLLKELGAKQVFAVVTHITGDAKDAVNSPYLDKLIVTDTVPLDGLNSSRVIVLSVAEELTQHIAEVMRPASGGSCHRLEDLLSHLPAQL